MQSKKNINVYDFDGTLYNGDSSIDFFFFCLKQNKKNILLLPKIFFFFLLYVVHFIKKEKFKSCFFSFLKNDDNPKKSITDFWKIKESNINEELKKIILEDPNAVIVSASPEFLIKPIAEKLGVSKYICSNVDIKTGMWLDNNCHGKNKIIFLRKKYKKFDIENSYSDSYSDRFIAQESKNAYLIDNKKIVKYDEDKLYLKKMNNISNYLATFFFAIYFIFGMLINFNYDLSSNFNLLFQSDTKRVYNDFSNIIYNHYRISVHPLILFFQPIILLINGITHNSFISIIIFQSIIGSLCIKYLFKTLCIIRKNKISNLLLSFIYGFSFSTIIFSSTYETYALSALVFILLWYNVIKDLKLCNKSNITKYIVLGIMASGILLTNYTVYGVILLVLLLSKKINIKKFILINLITIISIISLSFIQQFVWVKAPNIFSSFTTSVEDETTKYTSFDISIKKIKNEVDDVYLNGFTSKKIDAKFINGANKYTGSNLVMKFKDGYNYFDIIFIIFYGCLLIYLIKGFKQDIILNLGLIVSLLGMSVLHLFYGNDDTFLYSQNFIYLIILLFGLNYRKEKKYINLSLFIFLVYEIVGNALAFKNILLILRKYFTPELFLKKFGLIKEFIILFILAIILILIFYLIIILMKKHNKKNILLILCLLIITSCIFVKFETYKSYSSKKNNSSKIVVQKNTKYFEEKYKDDITLYNKYLNQYKKFVDEKNISVANVFNNEKFYFFGLGNRKKYVYSNGVIRELENEKIYKRFDVEWDLIIPNAYTVLIKTKEGNYYKIVEDKSSVKIIEDNKELVLPDTKVDIELYNFDDYKYSEILKVLYQEILFNIKDGIIYPNILVYDNVWYRDAAYGAMVLDKTGNIDLIKDWILSINSIYDKSNGEEENDNLGELLYMISLVDDKDNKLVKKILSKLEQIRIEDENGIYISNNTDGSKKPSYQTEWLKFGLNKLNIENEYNYLLTDRYTNLLWFTEHSLKDLKNEKYSMKYPYLGYAQRHMMGDNSNIYLSNQLYPLSWEKEASKANYLKMTILGNYYVKNKVSPTHIWSAAELFLMLEEKK